MDLEKLERQFHESRDALIALRDNKPKDEPHRFCQWIINTDINPYSLFFAPGYASSCLSIEGLHGVCLGILHALLDDGAMSFIAVNDEPVILMVHPSDFESEEAFFTFVEHHDEKRSLRLETRYKYLDISPDDFIVAREAYEVANLKSCFWFDADMIDLDTSISSYQKDPRFDPVWIDQFKSENGG